MRLIFGWMRGSESVRGMVDRCRRSGIVRGVDVYDDGSLLSNDPYLSISTHSNLDIFTTQMISYTRLVARFSFLRGSSFSAHFLSTFRLREFMERLNFAPRAQKYEAMRSLSSSWCFQLGHTVIGKLRASLLPSSSLQGMNADPTGPVENNARRDG